MCRLIFTAALYPILVITMKEGQNKSLLHTVGLYHLDNGHENNKNII